MDQGSSAVMGAFIGASAGIMGGVALEHFKRHRDRLATEVAIAASIETAIWMVDRRGHVKFFQSLLPRLKAGEVIPFAGFVHKDHLTDEIAQKHLDKIGLLKGDIGSRVVRFYTILYGIRLDLLKLTSGDFGTDPSGFVHIIEQDLLLWEEATNLGTKIVRDLRPSEKGKVCTALEAARSVWLQMANRVRQQSS